MISKLRIGAIFSTLIVNIFASATGTLLGNIFFQIITFIIPSKYMTSAGDYITLGLSLIILSPFLFLCFYAYYDCKGIYTHTPTNPNDSLGQHNCFIFCISTCAWGIATFMYLIAYLEWGTA